MPSCATREKLKNRRNTCVIHPSDKTASLSSVLSFTLPPVHRFTLHFFYLSQFSLLPLYLSPDTFHPDLCRITQTFHPFTQTFHLFALSPLYPFTRPLPPVTFHTLSSVLNFFTQLLLDPQAGMGRPFPNRLHKCCVGRPSTRISLPLQAPRSQSPSSLKALVASYIIRALRPPLVTAVLSTVVVEFRLRQKNLNHHKAHLCG